MGCAAPGTDFEALPFYREDRTQPGVVRAAVPLLLLSYDSYEMTRQAGVEDAGEDPGKETVSILRVPWPLGLFQKRGSHISYTFTTIVGSEVSREKGPLGPFSLGDAGPVGRGLSIDPEIRDKPFSLGADTEPGGFNSYPLVFWNTLVDHNDLPDVEGQDLDRDIGLLPFFAWGGGSRPEHEYFAMFPFGGTTRGILGKDKITWLGFPYPAYAKVEDKAYESTHIMWPFVNWLEGPHYSGSRVLPFYSHYERSDEEGNPVYERTTIMWPFYTHNRDGLNEEIPTETLIVWPFYGRIDGPGRDHWTVLWPFFKYTELTSERQGWGQDGPTTKIDFWELRAPFPFFIVAGGRDRWRFDLWPLFGVKERPGFHRNFFAWPIWRYESLDYEDEEFDGQWLLPFFWRTHWRHKRTGQEEHRWRLFPLFRYRRYKDGGMELATLAPWYRDDESGFERILEPFFRLYRYRRDALGGTEHQALLGLFSYRSIPALPDRGAYSRLSLLFGLFQYRNRGGEKGLRFLYMPEIVWGREES